MNKKAVLTLKIVTAFSAAAVVAGTMTYSYRTADKKKLENNDGLGGLEISAVPQYDTQEKIENSVSENVSDAEFIETDSVQDRKDLLALEEAEKKLIDGGLYYSSYRIKKGDMIGVIAEKYGISQDTLISVNKIRATRTIQIGQNIKIPSLDGILYTVKKDGETPETIAEKYEVSADEVANVNKIAVNASLDAGQSVFVPGAELDWITRQEINGDLFRKPIRSYYRITSYFGWRGSPFTGRRQFHGGIDMACSTGTPIYAAMEGVISYRGYINVSGNYVIVT